MRLWPSPRGRSRSNTRFVADCLGVVARVKCKHLAGADLRLRTVAREAQLAQPDDQLLPLRRTRHSFVRTLMGRRMEGTNEYTRYGPHKLVGFRATSGGRPLEASYVVEPAGSDCAHLTSRIELQAKGLLRFAEPSSPQACDETSTQASAS